MGRYNRRVTAVRRELCGRGHLGGSPVSVRNEGSLDSSARSLQVAVRLEDQRGGVRDAVIAE